MNIEEMNNKILEFFRGDSNFITSSWDIMRKPVITLAGTEKQARKCITLTFKNINTNKNYFTMLEIFLKDTFPYTETEIIFGDGHTILILVYR